MEVTFRKDDLKKCYEQSKLAIKKWNLEVAKKYIQRINIIKKVIDFKTLYSLPSLNCHPLKGTRKGQYAIKLTGFYRLIITNKGEKLKIIQIEEVSKHYDD